MDVVKSSRSKIGVVILGSTGSIGVNTLKVIDRHSDRFRVVGLAANRNFELLSRQVKRYRPVASALFDGTVSKGRTSQLPSFWSGMEGLCRLAALPGADIVVTAIPGTVGILPTYEAIKQKKRIALANKETLVAAGEFMMREAARRGASILPVDSEHSAIFQCLQGSPLKAVKRLIITGSGGPFRTRRSLANVTVNEALKHPTWRMGRKVTVDSSTLMNKGLEVIEAHHLFGVPLDRIEVVIHPQSIVHSLVEFVDGSVLAQLGVTDMRLPIQYALSYPDRWPSALSTLDLSAIKHLSFEPPATSRFPCLELAFEAAKTGGTMPAVLNAANEEAVSAFLSGGLSYLGIPKMVERVMRAHRAVRATLPGVMAVDRWAREETQRRMSS